MILTVRQLNEALNMMDSPEGRRIFSDEGFKNFKEFLKKAIEICLEKKVQEFNLPEDKLVKEIKLIKELSDIHSLAVELQNRGKRNRFWK